MLASLRFLRQLFTSFLVVSSRLGWRIASNLKVVKFDIAEQRGILIMRF